MTVEPFGELQFYERDKAWFGRVDNISPGNKVELGICVDSEHDKKQVVFHRWLTLEYHKFE